MDVLDVLYFLAKDLKIKEPLPRAMTDVETWIARLVRIKPRFGLELVGLRDSLVSRGSVYVHLSRMVQKGFLRAEPSEHQARKVIYHLTPYGERALKASIVRSAALSLLGFPDDE